MDARMTSLPFKLFSLLLICDETFRRLDSIMEMGLRHSLHAGHHLPHEPTCVPSDTVSLLTCG